MRYDKDIAPNWHLRFRLIIHKLTQELTTTQTKLNIVLRKLKKYENKDETKRNRKEDRHTI